MPNLQVTQDVSDLCLHCKACMDVCPFLPKYCNDPGELASSMLSGLYIIKPQIPFLCKQCGKCAGVCPTGLNVEEMMSELRTFIEDEDIPVPDLAPFL